MTHLFYNWRLNFLTIILFFDIYSFGVGYVSQIGLNVKDFERKINTMKYVSIFICVVLIIVSICLIPGSTSSDVTAGMGNGVNKELNHPEDIQALLSYISNENSETMDNNSTYGVSVLGYEDSEKSNDDNAKSKSTKKQIYRSVTIHENAYITSSSNSSAYVESGTYYSSANSTMNRQLSIYMTEKSSYYHSIGQISSSSSYDAPAFENDKDKQSSAYASFDLEIFFDSKSGDVFIKFNKWNMVSTSQTVIISNEILGRWVKFDGNAFDALDLLDSMNRSSLSLIGNIITMAIDDDMFNENKNSYSISKKDFKEILETDDLKTGEFIVDMSNAERPIVKMTASVSTSNKDDNNSSKYSANAYTKLEYVFENINNTIVEMDKNADILEIDEDDVEDYIIIED